MNIVQLRSLEGLDLAGNQPTPLTAAIRELRAAGCDVNMYVNMDVGVSGDGKSAPFDD